MPSKNEQGSKDWHLQWRRHGSTGSDHVHQMLPWVTLKFFVAGSYCLCSRSHYPQWWEVAQTKRRVPWEREKRDLIPKCVIAISYKHYNKAVSIDTDSRCHFQVDSSRDPHIIIDFDYIIRIHVHSICMCVHYYKVRSMAQQRATRPTARVWGWIVTTQNQ